MNVLIVHGDPAVCLQLQQQIARLDGYQPLSITTPKAEEALSCVATHHPEIVLLEASLPDQVAWHIAQRLQQLSAPPALVFLLGTNDPCRVALPKTYSACLSIPASVEELAAALRHAAHPSLAQLEAVRGRLMGLSLSARTRRGIEQVPLDQVLYLMADHKYVTLVHEGGELLLDESLKSLEEEFATQLVRVHRHTLVPKERMERLQRTAQGDYRLYLKGLDQGVTVSRRQLSSVRRLIPEAHAR